MQRMGDLSSQSATWRQRQPGAARKIEVVGPLLALRRQCDRRLVNVITDGIPATTVPRPTGNRPSIRSSARRRRAGDKTSEPGPLVFHFSGSGRRAGDFKTPDGTIPNSFNRAGYAEGGASYVTQHGYFGGSFAYDRTHYGIPFVEEGETNLDPRRKLFDLRGERRDLTGFINSFRASLGVRR
jgi:hypothetical protein